jgi:hypothetical protein
LWEDPLELLWLKELTVDCMVPSVPLGLAAIAAALLVVSMGCALWTVRPARVHKNPPPGELFLLSSVALMDRQKFVEAYKDSQFDYLVEKALIAIHGKAVYATEKFRWLTLAIYATLLSLGFLVVTSLVAIAAPAFAGGTALLWRLTAAAEAAPAR